MTSGFSYPQPIFQSPIYNPAFYLTVDASGYLTYDYAQTLYLDKNDYRLTYITGITQGTATQGVALIPGTNNDISGIGSLSCSSLTVNGSSVSSSPTYVLNITPGTAAINKALVLGASGEISTITSLTAMSITGTLQTATQSNITSLGTLSGLSIDGSLVFSGANRSITGLNSLSATSLTGTLQTAAQTNITSLGTLSGLTIGGNLTFTGASRSITGLASLTATSITGTLQTASQTNITSLGALTGLTIDGSLSFTGSFRSISGVSSISVVSSISSSIGNFGSIQINNSTIITSTPSITNVVDITCAGYLNAFAGIKLNSVAFVDASRNISAATLATTGDITIEGSINGFLAYGNQSAITNVGSLNELGIHSTPTNEYFTITGSGLDYLDGSYTRMMTLKGSNATPVQFQIEVNNGTNATSSNATWIGNYTNNDIRFGINNTTAMILTTTNRLGVGTSSPSAPLHIVGSNNFVFGAGGTTVYRLRTDNGITESALGPITYSVAAIFGGYISCSAMAMTSDRRLKRNIIDCPIDRIKILYDNVSVKLYDWIESENRPGQEVGLIAQDLVSARLTDLISIFYRDDIEEGSDLNLEPAKQQLNVDYSRISAYNMRMIQHLMQEIAEIKSRLANI